MNGRILGVQTWLQWDVSFPVVRIWCGLHQINLEAQKKYMSLGEDMFVTTLTGLIEYLMRQ